MLTPLKHRQWQWSLETMSAHIKPLALAETNQTLVKVSEHWGGVVYSSYDSHWGGEGDGGEMREKPAADLKMKIHFYPVHFFTTI